MEAAVSGVLPHALITSTAISARGKRNFESEYSMDSIRQEY
jgi:hypothetical protein